jgi:hypothetical protein
MYVKQLHVSALRENYQTTDKYNILKIVFKETITV